MQTICKAASSWWLEDNSKVYTEIGRKVSLSLAWTHISLNAVHSDTVISSSSKSAELWLVWVTVVGARETLWFIPARVISLVVNTGNSCIPKQWPPTSCPSERTRTCVAHGRLVPPLHFQVSRDIYRWIWSTLYIKMLEGRCWVKYDRWPRGDPTSRGAGRKRLRNEVKSFSLISKVWH